MPRKLMTVRTAVITAAAMAVGSTAGTTAAMIAGQHGHAATGVSHLAAAIATVWTLDKLNALIDDRTDG